MGRRCPQTWWIPGAGVALVDQLRTIVVFGGLRIGFGVMHRAYSRYCRGLANTKQEPTSAAKPALAAQRHRRWPDLVLSVNRSPVAVLVLVAEVLTAGYIALIAGLMSAWMVNDNDAFRMRDGDWVLTGCLRLAVGSTSAAVFTIVSRRSHRRWVIADSSPTWFRGLPWLLGGGIAAASATGVAWFIMERPFM